MSIVFSGIPKVCNHNLFHERVVLGLYSVESSLFLSIQINKSRPYFLLLLVNGCRLHPCGCTLLVASANHYLDILDFLIYQCSTTVAVSFTVNVDNVFINLT